MQIAIDTQTHGNGPDCFSVLFEELGTSPKCTANRRKRHTSRDKVKILQKIIFLPVLERKEPFREVRDSYFNLFWLVLLPFTYHHPKAWAKDHGEAGVARTPPTPRA